MASRKTSSRRRSTRTSRKASPRRRSSSTNRRSNALTLLKEDHERVRSLVERFERSNARSTKEQLAERICQELTLHAELEEAVFYPRVREAILDQDLMNEAEVEHASVKELIRKIESSSRSDPKFDALVIVLGEYVLHHVKEEEGEMFANVRRSDLDLVALGAQMKKWKSDKGAEKKQRGPLAALMGR